MAAKFNLTSGEFLEACRDIAEDYFDQGLRLTVRQLYYQIVSRGLETNGDHVYKRTVATLSKARLAGAFPMHLIEDRGRNVGRTQGDARLDVDAAERSAAEDLRSAPEANLWSGRWIGQPVLPFVWVEKEALSGVFEKPCDDLNVGLFPCKGYPSLQALWSFLEGVSGLIASEKEDPAVLAALEELDVEVDDVWSEIVILYFGDHDPDGLEIPRSALRNLEELVLVHGDTLAGPVPPIRFERVALTVSQIREFNPPPFPAKPSSARFAGYVEETGLRDAWELDALRPDVLRDLIRANVDRHFDARIWSRARLIVTDRREALRERISDPEWARGVLEEE